MTRTPNFNHEYVHKIEECMGITLTEEGQENSFTPLQLLDYIYAVLHSQWYITKYREYIKIEFPRIPYPTDKKKFFALAEVGARLRNVHCMIDSQLAEDVVYTGKTPVAIDKVSWKDNVLTITKGCCFYGITEAEWSFFVGGYQPLQKWLKDRKGMQLDAKDIVHYQKMVYAIRKTREIMQEIAEEPN